MVECSEQATSPARHVQGHVDREFDRLVPFSSSIGVCDVEEKELSPRVHY